MTIRIRGRAAVTTVIALALLAVALAASSALSSGGSHTAVQAVPTAFAPLVRTDVVERQQVAGTLDYAGSYTITNGGPAGIVTWLPAPGAIVRRDRPLFRLATGAVTLLYGSTPSARELTLGIAPGPDVHELQLNLRTLGFDADGALRANGRFDLATLVAVEQWQRARGTAITGDIAAGSIVFLPGPIRVNGQQASLGQAVQAGGPVLTATGAKPAVLVPLDPGSVSRVARGERVLVTMPDGSTLPGHVEAVGRVATTPASDNAQASQGNPTPTVPVTVSLQHPHTAGGLDQAPVQVAITEQEVRNVLAAPISALLAQPGGGYALAVAEARRTTRLVSVTTGLFDDVSGKVEVRGPGLAAGMRVQVPAG